MAGMTLLHRVMWVGRARILAFWFVAVVVAASSGLLLTANSAHADTFTVNYAGDEEDFDPGDGVCDTLPHPQLIACTLRAAIGEANETAGADAINFNIADDPDIPGKEVKTIKPKSALPEIVETVIIDGYTQPGAEPNTNKGASNNAVLKIELDGTSAVGLADALVVSADNCVVRGLVINSFQDAGVVIDSTASGNKVRGNFIGTNPAGTFTSNDLANATGVLISGDNNVIGGRYPGQRNVISGNSIGGVAIHDQGQLTATDNRVRGNRIGTNKNGDFDLGNDFAGVFISSASDNIIGGSRSGQANIIAFNDGDGVMVEDDASTGNRILRNSIHHNDGLGIDLVPGAGENIFSDVPTANDNNDTDTGPNNLQNYPEITFLFDSGDFVIIEGNLESVPNTTFTLRFFEKHPDQSDDGGWRFLAQQGVTTDSNGEASFELTTDEGLTGLGGVTATATDPNGNTSEFLP